MIDLTKDEAEAAAALIGEGVAHVGAQIAQHGIAALESGQAVAWLNHAIALRDKLRASLPPATDAPASEQSRRQRKR